MTMGNEKSLALTCLTVRAVKSGALAIDNGGQASLELVPWVFHRNGKPIRDFRKVWKTACTNAGCPGRIPHDFRRTAALECRSGLRCRSLDTRPGASSTVTTS